MKFNRMKWMKDNWKKIFEKWKFRINKNGYIQESERKKEWSILWKKKRKWIIEGKNEMWFCNEERNKEKRKNQAGMQMKEKRKRTVNEKVLVKREEWNNEIIKEL